MPKYVNWMIWFTSAVAAITDCYTGFVALTGGVSLVVNPWWFTLRVLAAIVMAASSWLSVFLFYEFTKRAGASNKVKALVFLGFTAITTYWNCLNAIAYVGRDWLPVKGASFPVDIPLPGGSLHINDFYFFLCACLPPLVLVMYAFVQPTKTEKTAAEITLDAERARAKAQAELLYQQEVVPLQQQMAQLKLTAGAQGLRGNVLGLAAGLGIRVPAKPEEEPEETEDGGEITPAPQGTITPKRLAFVLSKGGYRINSGGKKRPLSAENGARTVINWCNNAQMAIQFERRVVGRSASGKELVQYCIDEAAIRAHPQFGRFYEAGLAKIEQEAERKAARQLRIA
jgi:hypothetical protein